MPGELYKNPFFLHMLMDGNIASDIGSSRSSAMVNFNFSTTTYKNYSMKVPRYIKL